MRRVRKSSKNCLPAGTKKRWASLPDCFESLRMMRLAGSRLFKQDHARSVRDFLCALRWLAGALRTHGGSEFVDLCFTVAKFAQHLGCVLADLCNRLTWLQAITIHGEGQKWHRCLGSVVERQRCKAAAFNQMLVFEKVFGLGDRRKRNMTVFELRG